MIFPLASGCQGLITEYDGEFRGRSGVRSFFSRVDNECAIHCPSQPVIVGVPEIRSTLIRHRKLVNLRLPFRQGALCYIHWPVHPVRTQLLDSVPARTLKVCKHCLSQIHMYTKNSSPIVADYTTMLWTSGGLVERSWMQSINTQHRAWYQKTYPWLSKL